MQEEQRMCEIPVLFMYVILYKALSTVGCVRDKHIIRAHAFFGFVHKSV